MDSYKDAPRVEIPPETENNTKTTSSDHFSSNQVSYEQRLRKTVFKTRFRCNNVLCNVTITAGQPTNMVSRTLVEKLQLKTEPRPSLSLGGLVKQRCLVPVKCGVYSDNIWCDVVTMDSCDIWLSRPWQNDRGTMYDARENKYSFMFQGKRVVLLPLPLPQEESSPPRNGFYVSQYL